MNNKGLKNLQDYDLISEALIKFGITDKNVEFIRHNENLTLKIDEDYLLRIHKSSDSFKAISKYTDIDIRKMREAELSFIEHLRKEGMKLQNPIKSMDDTYIVELKDGIYATLLKWIPGITVDKEKQTPDLCREIGKMVGKMQKAAKGFHNENILQYDSDLCVMLKNRISLEISKGEIQDKYLILLEKTCDKLSKILMDKSRFITLHSDLSLSNILITDSGLVPIDFSLLGFAHPMMDIACLYGSLNGVESRKSVAEGYISEGFEIDFLMLDAQFALSVLLYIVMHLNLSKEEGFNKNIDRWCRQIFGPFVEDKRLISERFYMINADK